MADIKISQLGEALAVTDNDILPMTASGVTSKVKASTMKSYMVDDLDVSDLYDTTITTPTDDDGLVYDATAQKWENKQITTKEQWKKNGAYNHLPNNRTTILQDGTQFTVNADKTITATVPANPTTTNLYILGTNSTTTMKLPAGKYKLVGCPSGGNGAYYIQGFGDHDYTTGAGILDNGSGVEFTLTQENELYFFISIRNTFTSGGTVIFKPMLTTDLNATYDDYVEYAKTNRELTEESYVQSNTLAYNVDLSAYSSSSNTYIVPYDGYIQAATNSTGGKMSVVLCNGTITQDVLENTSAAIPVKKGINVYATGNKRVFYFRAPK